MKKNFSKHLKTVGYIFLFASVTCLIIILKLLAFDGINVLWMYTTFITTFMLSRVVGSFFYIPYHKRLSPDLKSKVKDYCPEVSFIIPCKNEEKSIYHTMANALYSDYPKNKVEVIAINDGSTDNTLQEMYRVKKDFSDRKVTIVNFQVNKGKREGMAEGFKRAEGEIVIQLDSDSFPAKAALKEIVYPFIDKTVGATVGHTDPSNRDKNWLTKMQTAYYFMSFRALKATESVFDMVFCCSGCFSAYRKEYVLPIIDAWRNETFIGKKIIFGDDRALTNWMIKLGYKTVYVAEAKAYTAVPEKLKQFLKQQVILGKHFQNLNSHLLEKQCQEQLQVRQQIVVPRI